MDVYLFKDYLRELNDDWQSRIKPVARIKAIDKFPRGLLEINGNLARSCYLSISDDCFFIEWVDTPKAEDAVSFSDEVQCPHCSDKISDSWELSDEGERECGSCMSFFEFSRNVEITYSTKIIERNETITKLD